MMRKTEHVLGDILATAIKTGTVLAVLFGYEARWFTAWLWVLVIGGVLRIGYLMHERVE